MKSAFEKKLNYIAAGIFLIGLIVNVSLSLTDPFIFVDTDVISQVSDSSSGSGSSSSSSGGVATTCFIARTTKCPKAIGGERTTCDTTGTYVSGETCTPVKCGTGAGSARQCPLQ